MTNKPNDKNRLALQKFKESTENVTFRDIVENLRNPRPTAISSDLDPYNMDYAPNPASPDEGKKFTDSIAARSLVGPPPRTPFKESIKEKAKESIKPFTEILSGVSRYVAPKAGFTESLNKLDKTMEPKKTDIAKYDPKAPFTGFDMFSASGPVGIIKGSPTWIPALKPFNTKASKMDQIKDSLNNRRISLAADLTNDLDYVPPNIARYGLPDDPIPNLPRSNKELHKELFPQDPKYTWLQSYDELLHETPKNKSRQFDLEQDMSEILDEYPEVLFSHSEKIADSPKVMDQLGKIVIGERPLPLNTIYRLARKITQVKKGDNTNDAYGYIETSPKNMNTFKDLFYNEDLISPEAYFNPIEVNWPTFSQFLSKRGQLDDFGMDEFGPFAKLNARSLNLTDKILKPISLFGKDDTATLGTTLSHEVSHALFGIRDPKMTVDYIERQLYKTKPYDPELPWINAPVDSVLATILEEARDVSMFILRPFSWKNAATWTKQDFKDKKVADIMVGSIKDYVAPKYGGREHPLRLTKPVFNHWVQYMNSEVEVIADGLSYFMINPLYAKKVMPTFWNTIKPIFNSDPYLNSKVEFKALFPIMAAGASVALAEGVTGNENSNSK